MRGQWDLKKSAFFRHFLKQIPLSYYTVLLLGHTDTPPYTHRFTNKDVHPKTWEFARITMQSHTFWHPQTKTETHKLMQACIHIYIGTYTCQHTRKYMRTLGDTNTRPRSRRYMCTYTHTGLYMYAHTQVHSPGTELKKYKHT